MSSKSQTRDWTGVRWTKVGSDSDGEDLVEVGVFFVCDTNSVRFNVWKEICNHTLIL